jgi:hypothetical protein
MTSRNDLPEGWEDFCTEGKENSSDNSVSVKCTIDIYNSGRWNYEVMMNHIAPRSMKYNFDIECMQGANISLTWPFKAINLKALKVQNCILADFFGNYENKMLATFPDALEYLHLSDVVAMVNIYGLMNFALNNKYNALCVNEKSLIEITMRNVTYNFKASSERFSETLSNATTGEYNIKDNPFMNEAQKVNTDNFVVDYICNYERLKTYDNSISPSRGIFYLQIKPKHSFFPVLENLNIWEEVFSRRLFYEQD